MPSFYFCVPTAGVPWWPLLLETKWWEIQNATVVTETGSWGKCFNEFWLEVYQLNKDLIEAEHGTAKYSIDLYVKWGVPMFSQSCDSTQKILWDDSLFGFPADWTIKQCCDRDPIHCPMSRLESAGMTQAVGTRKCPGCGNHRTSWTEFHIQGFGG